MILHRSLHADFVSNTYVVGDRPGGTALFVDAGGPVGPLIEAVEHHGLTPTHVLLTHHHHDHVCELAVLTARWPELEVLIHPGERDLVEGVTATMEPEERLAIGDLQVRTLHTPGHTGGMLSLIVSDASPPGTASIPSAEGEQVTGVQVFTGDTLFRHSVGGVRAPGHTTYADLRESVMDKLLALDPQTIIRPGHTEPTTVAEEWEHNPFVRIWRGLDPEGDEACTALDEPATLVLWGPDYDGGHKAWVRWSDGSDDIVPGSRVKRPAAGEPVGPG